jgi:hypothetical protein
MLSDADVERIATRVTEQLMAARTPRTNGLPRVKPPPPEPMYGVGHGEWFPSASGFGTNLKEGFRFGQTGHPWWRFW